MSKRPKVRTPSMLTDFNEQYGFPALDFTQQAGQDYANLVFGQTTFDAQGNPNGRTPGLFGDYQNFVQGYDFQRQSMLGQSPIKQDRYGRTQTYDKGLFGQIRPEKPVFNDIQKFNYGDLLGTAFSGEGMPNYSKYQVSTFAPGAGRSYSISAQQAQVGDFQLSGLTQGFAQTAQNLLGSSASRETPGDISAFSINYDQGQRQADTGQDDFAFMMNRATSAANARAAMAGQQIGATGKTGGQAIAALGQLQAQTAGEVAQAAFGATTAARQTALAQQQFKEGQYQFDQGMKQSYEQMNAGIRQAYDFANLDKNSQFAALDRQDANTAAQIAASLFGTSGGFDLAAYQTGADVALQNANMQNTATVQAKQLTEQARQSDAQYALGAGQVNAQLAGLQSADFANVLGFVTGNRQLDANLSLGQYELDTNRYNADQQQRVNLAGIDFNYNNLFAGLGEQARQFNLTNILQDRTTTMQSYDSLGNMAYNALGGLMQSVNPTLGYAGNVFNFANTQMQTKAQVDSASKSGAGALAGTVAGVAGLPLMGFNPITGAGLGFGFGGSSAGATSVTSGGK